MKLGVSTYSLHQAIAGGTLSLEQAIRYIADIGGEHVEIVPMGYSLGDNPALADDIAGWAKDAGLEVSNYAIGGNFAGKSDAEIEAEIERLKREVEAASRLGVRRMRHDAASHPDLSEARFDAELPRVAEACRQVADYAAGYGITTSVENHGFFLQASSRVRRLVDAVGRDNFRTTLDVGNFLCADEEPLVGVKGNLPYASMVHVKDFYRRPASLDPGEGWFRSTYGHFLRGAVVGHGDIDLREALRLVRDSGYDGYLSLEFEGHEECRWATRVGLDNLRRLWNEISVEGSKL